MGGSEGVGGQWGWFCRLLTFPPQCSWQREYEALEFLLFKSIPRHREVFKEVSENKLQPGDILLFPLDISSGVLSSSFKHMAIYCGDGEVIHTLPE